MSILYAMVFVCLDASSAIKILSTEHYVKDYAIFGSKAACLKESKSINSTIKFKCEFHCIEWKVVK